MGDYVQFDKTRVDGLGPYNPYAPQNPIVVQKKVCPPKHASRKGELENEDFFIPERHILVTHKEDPSLTGPDFLRQPKRARTDHEVSSVFANVRAFIDKDGKIDDGVYNKLEFAGVSYDTLPDSELSASDPHRHGRFAVITEGQVTIAVNRLTSYKLPVGTFIAIANNASLVRFDGLPRNYFPIAIKPAATADFKQNKVIGKIVEHSRNEANEITVLLTPTMATTFPPPKPLTPATLTPVVQEYTKFQDVFTASDFSGLQTKVQETLADTFVGEAVIPEMLNEADTTMHKVSTDAEQNALMRTFAKHPSIFRGAAFALAEEAFKILATSVTDPSNYDSSSGKYSPPATYSTAIQAAKAIQATEDLSSGKMMIKACETLLDSIDGKQQAVLAQKKIPDLDTDQPIFLEAVQSEREEIDLTAIQRATTYDQLKAAVDNAKTGYDDSSPEFKAIIDEAATVVDAINKDLDDSTKNILVATRTNSLTTFSDTAFQYALKTYQVLVSSITDDEYYNDQGKYKATTTFNKLFDTAKALHNITQTASCKLMISMITHLKDRMTNKKKAKLETMAPFQLTDSTMKNAMLVSELGYGRRQKIVKLLTAIPEEVMRICAEKTANTPTDAATASTEADNELASTLGSTIGPNVVFVLSGIYNIIKTDTGGIQAPTMEGMETPVVPKAKSGKRKRRPLPADDE